LDALDETAAPRVLQVLPRGMRYGRAAATSIDLYVSEMATHSRFRVEVVAECDGSPLPAAAVHVLPQFTFAETLRRSRRIAYLARALSPSAVVVQQHLPSAAALRARIGAPIILQKHNFLRQSRDAGWLRGASHWRRTQQLNALAGLTFVSRAVLAQFEQDWPDVTIARRVVANGFDARAWRPEPERAKTVLAVGRVTPEKGLLEAARALAAVLPRHADWTTTFVVSEPDRFPDYFAAIVAGSVGRSRRSRRSTNARRSRWRRRSGASHSAAPASRRTPAPPRLSPRAAAAYERSAATRRCSSRPSNRRKSPRRWKR
jgi:glycosyltransferase involved in cell wall biosynthesis